MSDPVFNRCPFCGEKMIITSSGLAVHEKQSQGACIISGMGIPADHEASVEKWNTRWSFDDITARVTELEAALDSEHASVGYNIWRFWSKKARELTKKNIELRKENKALQDHIDHLEDVADWKDVQ